MPLLAIENGSNFDGVEVNAPAKTYASSIDLVREIAFTAKSESKALD